MAASVTNLRPCERDRLAGAPGTSVGLLRALARKATTRVRVRLAANPSTQDEILAELWPWHPEAVLLNPRQDLEILTGGKPYLPRMGWPARRRLFFALLARGRVAEAKEWVMPDLCERRRAAPLAKGETTLPLAMDPDLQTRIAVARSRWLSEAAARALARSRSVRIHAALAGSPSMLPDDVVAGLASLQEKMTRARVAARKDAPREILARLAADRWAIVRRKAASNPRLSLPCLHELLRDTNPRVRIAALANPSALPEWLEEASASDDRHILLVVGGHPSTPRRVLLDLARRGPNAAYWSLLLRQPRGKEFPLAMARLEPHLARPAFRSRFVIPARFVWRFLYHPEARLRMVGLWMVGLQSSRMQARMLRRLVNDPDERIAAIARDAAGDDFNTW